MVRNWGAGAPTNIQKEKETLRPTAVKDLNPANNHMRDLGGRSFGGGSLVTQH